MENINGNYTNCFHGTSASAPLVAGVAALVLTVNQQLTATEVREILIETADPVDQGNAGYKPDSKNRPYSATHGYGRVNAAKAVRRAQELLRAGAQQKKQATRADSPVDQVAHGRLAASGGSGQPTVAPTVLAGGIPTERRTIQIEGKDVEVYCLKGVWALVLKLEARHEEVLREIGEGFRRLREQWALDLDETRNVLVVEGPPKTWADAERVFTPILRRGLIRSVGRVIFFDRNDPSGVAVLTDRLRVRIRAVADESRLDRFSEELGLSLGKNPLEPTEFTLTPRAMSIDPFELVKVAKKYEDVGLIIPQNSRPVFINPLQQRQG